MVYPAALLLIAMSVVTALMIFVVPTLVEQFRHLKGNLPLITRVLIGVSGFLTQFWPFILVGLVGAGLVIRAAFQQRAVRLRFDRAMLFAPLIGRWVRAVNASRFIRSVGVMTASGLPVLESVRASRDSVPNLEMSRAIAAMGDRIEEGEPLSHAMKRSGLVPSLAVYMAVGGENSGELPQMLDGAADYLDQEFESFIQAALSLVEPIIILVMGGVVASIILAIMLPILQLNQLVGA
jgi:general secretion pathway protein F